MIFSSCLSADDDCLVADASVLINLIATAEASKILGGLPLRVLTSEQAAREIRAGAANGHGAAAVLDDLIGSKLVTVTPMALPAMGTFSDLVSGSLATTLGDGEAATAAIAIHGGIVAGIDEKKATAICSVRYPALKIATSVDVLAHTSCLSVLGKEALASATLRALKESRMQVRQSQLEWIVGLIGAENARQCSSLRRLLAATR